MAVGFTLRKFGEVRPCGSRVMRADRQTSKQTYSSQYFAPLPGRSKNQKLKKHIPEKNKKTTKVSVRRN